MCSKNIEIKYYTDGPLRYFKNLAKKLSDFDKNLTTQKTICVDLLVKISSKSDNFSAKFLNYLKGPSVEYLISMFFEHIQLYVN